MKNWLNYFRAGSNFRKAGVALAFGAFAIAAAPPAQSQTYSVVFSLGAATGIYPVSGVTVDRAGNLYGTSYIGGPGTACYEGCGTVFKLSRHGSGWIATPLHSFMGGEDGGNPGARPVVGPDGSLFGTTTAGGGPGCYGTGCGVVYQLRPPQRATGNILGGWSETVIYRFDGGADGAMPEDADLYFDPSGNIYGTTDIGGGSSQCQDGCGTVYKLTRSNGAWTESIVHSFGSGGDGQYPWVGLIPDQSGNLYSTTSSGGAHRDGTVYELTPSANGWSEQVIYSFQDASDGYISYGGLVEDQAGNFYGTTCCGGPVGGGAAFQLTHSDSWVFTTIQDFSGEGPYGGLVMDASGNLYGSTSEGGAYNFGMVFKLSPGIGGWTSTSLYDFCPGGWPCTDGAFPSGTLAIDAAGNLYGTTMDGGLGGGVVFEVTP